MATPAETLAVLDQKIHDLIGGGVQSVTRNGVSYDLIDLDKLTRLRDQLQARADAESSSASSSTSRYAEFGRPS